MSDPAQVAARITGSPLALNLPAHNAAVPELPKTRVQAGTKYAGSSSVGPRVAGPKMSPATRMLLVLRTAPPDPVGNTASPPRGKSVGALFKLARLMLTRWFRLRERCSQAKRSGLVRPGGAP